MLYFPWYSDLLGGYYEKKYTLSDVENIELDEDGPHAWDHGTEANRAQHEAEGPETLTDLSEQDVKDNTTSSSLHVRYDANHGHLMNTESF